MPLALIGYPRYLHLGSALPWVRKDILLLVGFNYNVNPYSANSNGEKLWHNTLLKVLKRWTLVNLHAYSILPGVQVTAGLGIFLHSGYLNVSDDSDSPVAMRCIPF